jgi:hypothetical protein
LWADVLDVVGNPKINAIILPGIVKLDLMDSAASELRLSRIARQEDEEAYDAFLSA